MCYSVDKILWWLWCSFKWNLRALLKETWIFLSERVNIFFKYVLSCWSLDRAFSWPGTCQGKWYLVYFIHHSETSPMFHCLLSLFFTSFLWTDDLLCTIDFKYSRKKKQSVREHLKSLQKPPCNVIRGGDDTIDEVSDMYEHARFETKVNFIIHEWS